MSISSSSDYDLLTDAFGNLALVVSGKLGPTAVEGLCFGKHFNGGEVGVTLTLPTDGYSINAK